MTDVLLHKCEFCNYQSKRKYDVKRHLNAKHKCQIIENYNKNLTGENVIPSGENVIPNGENVIPNGENVIPNGENVILNQNMCKKCNKIYFLINKIINNKIKFIKIIINSTFLNLFLFL